ncbi:MAG TPA: FecR family protein [Candidatus Saccharimonadales bacterium]|nr:FecR family protein [Candidatus Saccharimonadales bacterium]
MRNDYLWDGSGEPDPEIQKLEKAMARFRLTAPAPSFRELEVQRVSAAPSRAKFFWVSRVAAAAVVAVSVTAAGLVLRPPVPAPHPGSGWEITNVDGTSHIGESVIRSGHPSPQLEVGQLLATSSGSRATLSVADIGRLDLEPDTHVRLLESGSGRKRVALLRGTIRASIWAPPGEFVVDTPSAVAVDLGCVYTLQVEAAGGGTLRTLLGWVGFQQGSHESFIPAGAMCRTRANAGPGTPYFEDASEAFRGSLHELDFGPAAAAGHEAALRVILQQARPRDALTLWHLLTRVEDTERQRVYERLAALVPPPRGITRDGILALDPAMMDLWWNEFALGDISLWRSWKQRWPQTQNARR